MQTTLVLGLHKRVISLYYANTYVGVLGVSVTPPPPMLLRSRLVNRQMRTLEHVLAIVKLRVIRRSCYIIGNPSTHHCISMLIKQLFSQRFCQPVGRILSSFDVV
jgi:hypothetical protein